MRRFLATAALAAMLVAGAATGPSTSGAAAAPALPQAASCSGVWVVVDFGSLGGITTKCATSYGTGAAALRSAGFSPTISEGFVEKINGKPGKPDTNKAYWSYWHATRNSDGGYNGWTYSNLGANSYKPTAGNAEGWRYQSLDDGKVPPGAAPPAADTPKPTPSKTSSKPSPKPSATKKPSSKPSTSKKPSATATTTSTSSATAKAGATTRTPTATASGTPTSTGRPSPSDAASPTPSEVATDPVTQATPVAESADASSSGSPAGLITTVGIVLAGAAGLGGWWWKGRKS